MITRSRSWFYLPIVVAFAAFLVVGLTSSNAQTAKPAAGTIRIKAGATTQSTDSDGNVWLPGTDFKDGDAVDREAGTKIDGAKDSSVYLSERFGMTAFSRAVPNGKYTVKLHFAETSGAVGAVGERVFDMNVEGKEIKDFDPMAKAGGKKEKAYVETVPVEVTDGKLDITFTAKTQNPAINAIEIIPGS